MKTLINIIITIAIFFLYSCNVLKQNTVSDNLKFKTKLDKEVSIYINYLDKIKGKDSSRVVLVTKYKIEKLTLYLFENYNLYFTNYEKDFQYENCPTLVPTEVPLNAFKFVNNTLVCLYNNDDLPGADLSINRIPNRYKSVSYAIFDNPEFDLKKENLRLQSKIIEHKEKMFYVIFARTKNGLCLYEKKYTDTSYESYRRIKFKKAKNCIGIDYW